MFRFHFVIKFRIVVIIHLLNALNGFLLVIIMLGSMSLLGRVLSCIKVFTEQYHKVLLFVLYSFLGRKVTAQVLSFVLISLL